MLLYCLLDNYKVSSLLVKFSSIKNMSLITVGNKIKPQYLQRFVVDADALERKNLQHYHSGNK